VNATLPSLAEKNREGEVGYFQKVGYFQRLAFFYCAEISTQNLTDSTFKGVQ